MMTENSRANVIYDSTQLGYIRLQTAINLLEYLSTLYVAELPESTIATPSAVRRLTKELEKELQAYIMRVAPDALPGRRKTPIRRAFSSGKPRTPKVAVPDLIEHPIPKTGENLSAGKR